MTLTDHVEVALFDLDKTVLDCNSGTLWLAAEWRERRIGVGDVLWGSTMLGLYHLGFSGLDEAFQRAASILKGVSETEIEHRTRSWFESEVAHRARPGALSALRHHRDAGHRLVVATSSSIYAGREASRWFGFDDVVSTELEVEAGHFTGRIAASAFGRGKAERVVAWADANRVPLARCAFYTDSYSDLPLLELVGTPVVVHPDRRLRREAVRRGWPIVEWGIAKSGGV